MSSIILSPRKTVSRTTRAVIPLATSFVSVVTVTTAVSSSDNAAQHGGRTVTITLCEYAGEAVLAVADDGQGIPAHLRERVFERFARVDEARSSSNGISNGSGLGLAIARELIAGHGGTIAIDPGQAAGIRFVVRLPLSRGATRPGPVF
ncbi:sensor histidine kinase KdpD [Cryobacterium sp. TMT1-3]|uniref:sensor histidine kinase n=1 Tax=Cryobacterium sp. TMT1-3 TaxID=1259237 RepID=UPI000B8A48B3|nr:sensor histidine kinase [Cryobacterium sp. TMT1-3]